MATGSLPAQIGRYQVQRLLGRGAMGAVYEARDPALMRTVAVKTLDKQEWPEPERAQRFLRESRAMARLAHPNVVAVHDVGEEGNLAYMVMQMLPGHSLEEHAEPGRAWPAAAVLRVAEQLLSALAYVHAAGIVHRDVKPANVMVDADGAIKLTDFGVAHLTDAPERTQAGTVIGTPRYMAPEQLLGKEVGPWTDLYGAAALLYQLFTGHSAFPGDSVFQVMQAVLQSQPRPPSAIEGLGLPAALDAVLLKAMARDPSDRHRSADELALALREALGHVGPPLPPPARRAAAPVEPDAGGLDALFDREFGLARPPAAPDNGSTTVFAALTPADNPFAALSPPSVDPFGGRPLALPGAALIPADSTMFLAAPAAAARTGPAPAPRLQLLVTSSADARQVGRSLVLGDDAEVKLGRAPTCSLVLNDFACSREHAVLRRDGLRWLIEDLGSRNGTSLDGRALAPKQQMPLMPGAAIRIGDTTISFNHADDTTLPDLTGQLIAGRYRVERVLRASPKATVYAARSGEFGPQVALKLLSPALAEYPDYLARVRRSAEVASRLQHPHVCPLLDHGVAEVTLQGRVVSTPYLSHALLAGGSLARRIAVPPPPQTAEIARWLRQTGEALAHAHRRGVVHGDVKPTSIAFDAEGNAYLMDFAMGGAEGSEAPLFGAPAYMAPELWAGAAPDPASDQFALAALAYALFTGVRPFSGHEDPRQRERNFRRGAAPVHEEARHAGREDLPRAVSPVLQRALAVEPGQRFASVAEFVEALDRALRRAAQIGAMPSVFVSYQHAASAGWAVLLARELKERHKISAFVDTQRLDAAVQFPDKLARAIEHCDVFACLLAADTLDSRWVLEEIRLAHRHGKPMVPIFQESFVASERAALDEAVQALLQFDGVHLLDRRNIHVDHTIDDLARLVTGTVRKGAE